MGPLDHIDEDLIIAYAEDPQTVANRDIVEEHLAGCSACWKVLEDYRTLIAGARDEETWFAERTVGEAGGDRQSVVLDFGARIAAEDEEAARLLKPFIDSPYLVTSARITRKKRFYTGGVVRALCAAARDVCDNDPEYSLHLSDAAQLIAATLPDDYYPASAVNELRGTAWKEYANACRYLGKFTEGFDALARAERAYRRLVDPRLGLAAVKLSRAILLWKQEKYAEALPLARAAATDFAAHPDGVQRYFEAREVEAIILQRLGDVNRACDTYRAIYDIADSLGDLEMKARTAKNLGVACQECGDLGSASKYLLMALQIYEALKKDALVVRTRWAVGLVALSAGNFPEAARGLLAVDSDLIAKAMLSDSAKVKLDLAEALLMLGRLDEVEALCVFLVAYFRNAEMVTGALTAAAFLKEAAARRKLTREHVQYVRRYLAALERTPDLVFAPPPAVP